MDDYELSDVFLCIMLALLVLWAIFGDPGPAIMGHRMSD